MKKTDEEVVQAIEEALGEGVTMAPYGVSEYRVLTGKVSGRKFTAVYSEDPMQMHSKYRATGAYTTEGRFLVEAENIRALAEKGVDVPAIVKAGENFMVMPWLGENLRLDDSIMSASERLDGIVLGMMERMAAIHSVPMEAIPYTTACTKDNLESKLSGTFLDILATSEYNIARRVRGDKHYARLCELVRKTGQTKVMMCLTKGEAYNPENVFVDGEKLSLTDYRMAGTGDAFMDIVNPISWGLPADVGAARSKKQQRLRRYLRARGITDEQEVFREFDYFTIGDSFNMMDVVLGGNEDIRNPKRKTLFQLAHRNMEALTSGDGDLEEMKEILLGSIPELC